MAPPASNTDFAIRVFSELGVVHIANEDRSMLINQLRTEFVKLSLRRFPERGADGLSDYFCCPMASSSA